MSFSCKAGPNLPLWNSASIGMILILSNVIAPKSHTDLNETNLTKSRSLLGETVEKQARIMGLGLLALPLGARTLRSGLLALLLGARFATNVTHLTCIKAL